MGLKSKNAKNAPVISTIGVALAMVRDMVERTIPNPSEEDILRVRREAEEKAVASGANPDTIEVQVDVDTSKNLVRAIAIGTTELRSKDLAKEKLSEDEIRRVVAENLSVPCERVHTVAFNGQMYAMQCEHIEKKFIFKKITTPTRIVDDEGVIRLQKKNGHVRTVSGANWKEMLKEFVEKYTEYGDGGAVLPNVYVVMGKRIIDLSGLESKEYVVTVANAELAGAKEDDRLILICSDRLD